MATFAKTLQNLWVEEYSQPILQEIQQLTEKTRDFIPVDYVQGGARRYQIIEPDAEPGALAVGPSDTVATEMKYRERWLVTSPYVSAHIWTKQQVEKLGSIESPAGQIVAAQRAAVARMFDKIAVNGILGNAIESYVDHATQTTVAFDENLATVPVGYKESGAYAASGLTLEKLLRVQELFGLRSVIGQNVDPQQLGGPEVTIFVTQTQIKQLLQQEEVKSVWYNERKTLVDGRVFDFLGMRFVVVNPNTLPKGTRKMGAAATVDGNSCLYSSGADVAGVTSCVAFVRNAVRFGITREVETHVDQLPTKNYAWQSHMSFVYGACRIDDLGVIKIDCA